MEMETYENGLPVEDQAMQQSDASPVMPEEGGTPAGTESVQDAANGPVEEPPKRRRTSRKKADKPMEDGATANGDLSIPDEKLPDDDPSEADRLDPETGAVPNGDCVVVGLADQNENDPPAGAEPEPQAEPRTRARKTTEGHSRLLSLRLNELDRNLTEQERQEWNDIYASYRSKSVLTGKIIGVEAYNFNVRNRETGQVERRKMYCAAVISLRVKVLIPETEMWMPGEERPTHVLRNMSGAEIDYVILDVDREGGIATASRRMGVIIKRRGFDTARGGHEVGERLPCRILTVGPSRCLVECGGRDITLRYQDISYSSYDDLRKKYHPGDSLDCILKEYDRTSDRMKISIKEAAPNPFEGAVIRHPLGCRRQAVISGKYGGGVFCTIPDGTTCLCLYTAQHTDRDFRKGDTVILVIVKYDYERSLIYGRILSKW